MFEEVTQTTSEDRLLYIISLIKEIERLNLQHERLFDNTTIVIKVPTLLPKEFVKNKRTL